MSRWITIRWCITLHYSRTCRIIILHDGSCIFVTKRHLCYTYIYTYMKFITRCIVEDGSNQCSPVTILRSGTAFSLKLKVKSSTNMIWRSQKKLFNWFKFQFTILYTAQCWQVTAWGELSVVAFFRAARKLDSDLAWVNGKSGRQSWCYADAFQRSIIPGAIYHYFKMCELDNRLFTCECHISRRRRRSDTSW